MTAIKKLVVRKLVKELEAKKKSIGLIRDELNDLKSDIEQLETNCEDAITGIETAIDSLSELC
jgi:archaellum component FlaC